MKIEEEENEFRSFFQHIASFWQLHKIAVFFEKATSWQRRARHTGDTCSIKRKRLKSVESANLITALLSAGC